MITGPAAVMWLARHPRSTAAELAAAHHDDPAVVQRVLHDLLHRGDVRREQLGSTCPWLWSAAAGETRTAARVIHLDLPDGDVARAVRDAAAQAVTGGEVTFLAAAGGEVAKITPLGG